MTPTPTINLIQSGDWLHEMATWQVVLALIVAMMIASTIGFVAGRRRYAVTGESDRGHFNAVQASLLGLLALLLGFNINMADGRYETRRQLVVEDADNLAALHTCSGFLPASQRAEFNGLLRAYVETCSNPKVFQQGISRQDMALRLAQAVDLHARMFQLIRTEIQGEPPARGVETMAPLVIKAQEILWRRVYTFQSRVPTSIIILLLSAAVAAAGVVGYSGGLGQDRCIVQNVMLALFVSGTLYVILDLDRPLQGIMRVDQTPMLQLKRTLDQEAETSR